MFSSGPSFKTFNKSHRHNGSREKLRDLRTCKVSIVIADLQGIMATNAFHRRGFLFLNCLSSNSLSQFFSAFPTRSSALWSSSRGSRSWSLSDLLFPSFNTSFIQKKNRTDSTPAPALGFVLFAVSTIFLVDRRKNEFMLHIIVIMLHITGIIWRLCFNRWANNTNISITSLLTGLPWVLLLVDFNKCASLSIGERMNFMSFSITSKTSFLSTLRLLTGLPWVLSLVDF